MTSPKLLNLGGFFFYPIFSKNALTTWFAAAIATGGIKW